MCISRKYFSLEFKHFVLLFPGSANFAPFLSCCPAADFVKELQIRIGPGSLETLVSVIARRGIRISHPSYEVLLLPGALSVVG